MEIDLFKHILGNFPNLKRIKLQGMGEPLLNKNLPEMIRIAGEHGIKTSVITNGTLLTETLANNILESKLSRLSISFDGATKQTYEHLRKGADFNRVIQNIHSFYESRNRMKACTEIHIICLISEAAVLEELPALIRLASNLGVDEVKIKKRLKIWEKTGTTHVPAASIFVDNFSHYSAVIDKATRVARACNIKFSMVNDPDYSFFCSCDWPWRSLYVSVEGKVVPCCTIGNPDTWCMGDFQKENLTAIWNNALYRNLRKQICLNRIPEFCKSCYR